ncbi:MAG: type II secretion system protein GspG [Planctomycetota bacterium]
MPKHILPAFVALQLVFVAPACAQEASEQEPWLRVDDSRRGVLDLDVAERRYTMAGAPDVTLVGAIHIGDPRYYMHLEKTLSAFDIVLYEGVGPAGAGELSDDLTDEQRVSRTESRLRLFAMMLESTKRAAGDGWTGYPQTVEGVRAMMVELDMGARSIEFLEAASSDGWGRPLMYEATGGGEDFRLLSYGADGEQDGRGVDRDLSFDLQPPLSDAELGGEPGLQQKMAKTFGLAFQGDIMSHDYDNHINSDLSIDEVRDLLEAKGGDGSMIFGMLDGSSGMAAMADVVFRLIEWIPGGSAMGKLMIMEMLANADDALAMAGQQQGVENPGALMEVIIVDRNLKVIEDLKPFLRTKRMWNEGIAVIYGAGHMPDLHDRLLAMGYELSESDWNLAMRLNTRREGIDPMTADLIRGQIRSQLEMMTRQAEEAAEDTEL